METQVILDTKGNRISNGDTIITDRGLKLPVHEENGVLFFVNEGNMQKRKLSELDIGFTKMKKKHTVI